VQIWVDADACPKVSRDILFRAAERARITVTLIANQPLNTPRSRYIKAIQVSKGFDVADSEIVLQMQPGDLVITADIPLAAAAIGRGGRALSPRGKLYTTDNIHERLAMRDFLDTLRGSGVVTNGPPPLTQSDRKAFADALDRLLAKRRGP
jgi:uncharacterized protein